MSIGLLEQIFMYMRKSPVNKIKRALKNAEENGIDINVANLESHYLAGGNGEKVIEAMILAKQNEIKLDYIRAAAIDLSGKDIVEIIKECFDEHEYTFDKYSKDSDERIKGYCKDGQESFAMCKIKYRKPIEHVWGDKLPLVQEHLSARIAVIINTEDSLKKLELMKNSYKPTLLKIAREKMETIKDVEIAFSAKKF